MQQKKKKTSLAFKIFIGLILGIGVGLALMGNPNIANDFIKPIGTIFLNLLKFIVVPIVLFSILNGIISMKDIKKVGAIGWKTMVYYISTTAIAVTIGLILANLLSGMFTKLSTSGLSYKASQAPSFMSTIVNIFPDNMFKSMVEANMLQVIVIAVLFGFATILTGEEKSKVFANFVESANEVCMKLMHIVIQLSPIGVFCLIVPVVAVNGPQVLGSLTAALAIAYLAYIIHATVVYSLSVSFFAGISPLTFFKGMMPAMMMAFSSASSVGTLPINMECAENLGAKKDIVSFVLPLGATVNMDGTAIYQGVCAVFIATCFGVDLTLGQMVTIVLSATLASIGTAGVPGSGMIMLAMVLQSVGLPLEGIALVAGVDRIFDMGRTTVNITGDSACALVVSALESKKA